MFCSDAKVEKKKRKRRHKNKKTKQARNVEVSQQLSLLHI